LKTPQFDSIINYRDWGIGLSRRFRALKLWFVLRCFGTDGIQNKLRHHLNLASKLESWMTQEKDFEIMSPLRLNLLCFRYNPKSSNDLDYLNTLNMQLLELLNSSGKLFLTHTKLDNQIVLRMLIGQTDIQEHHVQGAWMDIQEAARSLLHMHRDF
jgi:aromatic-L-amino-acid decarboxylase